MAKKIRTKTVQECVLWGEDWNGYPECEQYGDVEVPIRDWEFSPAHIAKKWKLGDSAPSPVNLTIQLPELNEVYKGAQFYVYKIKKTFVGVDFINITSEELEGDTFKFRDIREKATVLINFQNVDNLPPGTHHMSIVIEAYGLWETPPGLEYLEDCTIVLDEPYSISIEVIANDDSFNTDKNTYNITYNKADESLSGDTQVIIYTSEELNARAEGDFISFDSSYNGAEQILTLKKNTALIDHSVGNYTGAISITKGTTTKRVSINLSVINDTSQFYVDPEVFNVSVQKIPSESIRLVSQISNPNGLNIQIKKKPDFISSASIENNQLIIYTKDSANLNAGTYSDFVTLQTGNVSKNITINLNVSQDIEHSFKEQAYYFALDKHKVKVRKTKGAATYVKMVLDMFFQGYREEYREQQVYHIPFFDNKVEFFPGDEVQDFFIRCRNLSKQENAILMNLAVVNMSFHQMSENDKVLSTSEIRNVLFAPGKKPKCFPFFTNYPVRRTFDNSELSITIDSLTDNSDFNNLKGKYTVGFVALPKGNNIQRFFFDRSKFIPELKNNIISAGILKFVPFPEDREVISIEWETDNLVFDWFSAPKKFHFKDDLEHILGASKYHTEEKYGSSYSSTLVLNTGWILREEIDLITDILKSRICFITIDDKRYKAYPVGKKNELNNSEENLFQMDLEFKILRDER